MTDIKSLNPPEARFPIGVGLKSQHYMDVLEGQPELAFFEVHAENYMMQGGNHIRFLEAIAEKYCLSVHGVGMSLGSAEGVDKTHLAKFKEVVDRYNPWLVSEHLAWSVHGGHYLNDLLPLPLNATTLAVVSENIDIVQDAIGRQIFVENPSTYVSFNTTDIPEPHFLNSLAKKTGCGVLLDVNNIYVSAKNNNIDAHAYLDEIAGEHVGEIHLAGHTVKEVGGSEVRIDDHGSHVVDDVWSLYQAAIIKFGPRPSLLEWDTNIPSFDVLMTEAKKAEAIMMNDSSDEEIRYGAA
ncbi:MNIO family bufferin maturase [Kordiimonas aquimaris]|uniref:MNIO family bufferin maturase n=1 Tax=Kordiimonas aquimaris TaxID=707591 RepID=UPI0021CE9E4A|nr:DUF692 domain-containing protein [Kordiimonas aquimaris]